MRDFYQNKCRAWVRKNIACDRTGVMAGEEEQILTNYGMIDNLIDGPTYNKWVAKGWAGLVQAGWSDLQLGTWRFEEWAKDNGYHPDDRPMALDDFMSVIWDRIEAHFSEDEDDGRGEELWDHIVDEERDRETHAHIDEQNRVNLEPGKVTKFNVSHPDCGILPDEEDDLPW
jgi:hypothetical protein